MTCHTEDTDYVDSQMECIGPCPLDVLTKTHLTIVMPNFVHHVLTKPRLTVSSVQLAAGFLQEPPRPHHQEVLQDLRESVEQCA